ncbi:DUF3703 domain-containing protein [Shewanella sp. 125m-7]
MRQKLRDAFNSEMNQAIQFYQSGGLDSSFHHLERAHILGQSFVITHVKSHWWMLKIGWQKRDFKEVFGQCTRIMASVLFTKIWVPLGNTGGANVSPLKPMPIPEDLQQLISEDSANG